MRENRQENGLVRMNGAATCDSCRKSDHYYLNALAKLAAADPVFVQDLVSPSDKGPWKVPSEKDNEPAVERCRPLLVRLVNPASHQRQEKILDKSSPPRSTYGAGRGT